MVSYENHTLEVMSLQILIRGFLDNAEFLKIIYMWTERFMKEQEQEMEKQREKICQLQSKISVDNIDVLAPVASGQHIHSSIEVQNNFLN